MKRIADGRKLIGATAASSLKELNALYRGLMKSHHPDRFPHDEEKRKAAEDFSKQLIDAYKFLESIHPDTHAAQAEAFELAVASSITDWHYERLTLQLTFGDGSSYEFFGVPAKTYNKFLNTDGNTRFARRHIFEAFTYRKTSGATAGQA